MSDDLFNDIQVLRTRLDDLIARGTTPDALAAAHADWIAIQCDIETLCDHIVSAAPHIAHNALDDVREMIEQLNSIKNEPGDSRII